MNNLKKEKDLYNIECRGYGVIFILAFLYMLFVLIVSIPLCIGSFDYDFVFVCYLLNVLFSFSVVINMILIIKNRSFSIKNNEIIYKDWLGKIFKYSIKDIQEISFIRGLRRNEIKIKMIDEKEIVIIEFFMTKFDLLRERFEKEKLI